MAENLSILEFLQHMIDNVGLRDWFAKDPQGALAHYGLKDVSPEDVRDAIVLADDSQTADFSRSYDTGFHGTLAPAHTNAAHTNGGHDGSHSEHHASGHHEAVEHLSRYVTNNFVDDRDTNVDDSVNQQINTHGGDVDQHIDTHSATASGDGAVAAGDDIRDSTITSGDDNQVGDGNIKGDHNVQGDDNQVVHGDDNHSAFGSGASADSASLHDVDVSGGSALAVGGAANGSQANTDSHNHTTNTVTDTLHIEDSGNVHADTTENSNNHTHEHTDSDSHDHTTTEIGSHDHIDLPVI